MFSLSLPAVSRVLALLSALTATATAASLPARNDNVLESRSSVAWQARHGLTSAQYQQTFDSLVAQGYRLSYVAGYSWYNDARYAAIWDKNVTADWVARHGLTSQGYQSAFDTYVSEGYRPKHVYGYAVGGPAEFAAIWDKSPAPGNGNWVARHGLTSDQYQQAFDTYLSQGYRLVHVSGYADSGQARYAGLWERPSDPYPWVARHGLTSSQYQAAFNSYVGAGYRLVKVSGYVVGGVDYYAAIWDKKPSPPWVARHGLTSAQYQSEFNNWVGQGYRLTVVSAYTIGSDQDRYAAIWVLDQ